MPDADWSEPTTTDGKSDRYQQRHLGDLLLCAGSANRHLDGRYMRRDDDVPWFVCADVLHHGERHPLFRIVAADTATSQVAARAAAEQAASDYLATRAA